MDTNMITTETILKAFQRTGLEPRARVIYWPENASKHPTSVSSFVDPACGCAIGALALAFERLDPRKVANEADVLEGLEITKAAYEAIAGGFDDAIQGRKLRCRFEPGTEEDRLERAAHAAGVVLRNRKE